MADLRVQKLSRLLLALLLLFVFQLPSAAYAGSSISFPQGAEGNAPGVTYLPNKGIVKVPALQANGAYGAYLGEQVLYEKSYWSDLSDFTATGQAATIVNGAIRFNPTTTGQFSAQQLMINNISPSTEENFDFTVIVQLSAAPGTTSYGMSLGRLSINPWWAVSAAVQWSAQSNGNTLGIWGQASGTPGSPLVDSNLTYNAVLNDIVRLTWSQRASTIYCLQENLTQGKRSTLIYDSISSIPNAGNWMISGLGGQLDILSIRFVSHSNSYPNVLCIGDSKTAGINASAINLRYPALLRSIGPVAVFAGDGDRTVEVIQELNRIISFHPLYVLLNIGRNDLSSSVPAATWQANYQNIVATLTSAGITVVHLMPIPETNVDQSTLSAWISATYPSALKIDVSPGWNNSTMLSSDNIHPNSTGYRYIAQQIIASGLITPLATIPTPIPFMYNSADNDVVWGADWK
jgi:lysophospholipase L1-like esterase